MRTLALNANGDTYKDASGNIAILVDLPACMQCCATAMRAQRGEMIYTIDDGMPTKATAFDRYDPVAFEAAARSILSNVQGVTGIASFVVSRQADVMRYSANIVTIYGAGVLNGEL